MTLRPMRAGDADAVAHLHATSWRSAYRGIVPDSFLDHDVFADRQDVWRERLQTAPVASAFGIVAEDASGRMVGFAYVLPHHEPVCGTLVDNLHVHPELKGGGIGRRLLQAVVRELGPAHTQPLHLWVLDQNEPAKRFYARLGAEFIDPGMTPPFGGVCLPEWRCIWRDPSTLLTGDPLALRAELAGLDASAPPQQADIDGWLIRLSPGKAKRSRCINALRQGSLPLDELLARCQQAYEAAGLPLAVRVTPWSQPADLDAQLAAKGWGAFDAADVMVMPALTPEPAPVALQALDGPAYAALVGALRGSSATAIAAHAERIANAPVTYQGFALNDATGQLLACGQMVVDGDLVGLYDIAAAVPRQGHAERLCRALLALAHGQGARQAYLQVGSDNEAARRLYKRMGFVFAYRYHYRSPEAELL